MIYILLRSTLILLLSFALSLIRGRRSTASLRHLIWLSGLVAAALLPLVFAFLPELDLPLLPPRHLASAPATAIDVTQLPLRPIAQKAIPWLESASLWLDTHWLTALWAAGFAFVFIRFVLAVTAVRRLLRGSGRLKDSEWHDVLEELRSLLSISRPVQLLAGPGSFAPMVWGFARPTILLPAETAEWTDERRRFVLAHELAHVKRGDALTQFLTQIISAVYWFHPLVWLAGAQMRIERERACDDRVLNLGLNPHDYAGHLVEIARSVGPDLKLSYVSMSMTHPSQLEKRVNSILSNKTNRSALPRFTTVIVLGAAAALTAFLGSARVTAQAVTPQPALAAMPATSTVEAPVTTPEKRETASSRAPSPRPPKTQPAQTTASPVFQKWANEDVKYIISDAEKQAFLSLPTDAEREQFIEQFWLRRDPSPGTPQNEFKEEHYERIAYANSRFSYDNVPGWQTDRGHIYIIHGKPDVLESHPGGGTYARTAEAGGGTVTTNPFEVWAYRYIEGMDGKTFFEFSDPNRAGEYRLTMKPRERSGIVPPPAKTILFQVSSALSPKAGTTEVTTTIQIPFSTLSCFGEPAFCDTRVTVVISQGNRKIRTYQTEIQKDIPKAQFGDASQRLAADTHISLTSGVYSLEVTVQDMNTGVTGTSTQQLFIP